MFISSSSRLLVQLRYYSMFIHMNLSTDQVSFSPSKRLWCLNASVQLLTCQLLIPSSLTSKFCSDIVYPDFALSSFSSVLEGVCLQISLKSATIASHPPTPGPKICKTLLCTSQDIPTRLWTGQPGTSGLITCREKWFFTSPEASRQQWDPVKSIKNG